MLVSKPPRERETKVLRSVRIRLARLGIRLWRRNTGAMREGDRFVRFAAPGQADLWGFLPTSHACRHIEIEVKRPGNRPTERQLAWLKECTRLGAIAFWADNANTAEYVAEAILRGGRIVWYDNEDFDVEI